MRRLLLILCVLFFPLQSRATSTTFDAATTSYALGSSAATTAVAFTFCIWAYRTGNGEGGAGVLASRNAAADWVFRYESSTLKFTQIDSSPAGVWSTSSGTTLNIWQHLCVTYDGSATANNPVMYVNAASVTVSRDVGPGTVYTPATAVLVIGDFATGASWQGRLANACHYSRVLSASEISSVYRRGCRANPRNLVGYWPLGDFRGINLTATAGQNATETIGSGSRNGDGPPLSVSQGGGFDW